MQLIFVQKNECISFAFRSFICTFVCANNTYTLLNYDRYISPSRQDGGLLYTGL